jgi:hypothetical protein
MTEPPSHSVSASAGGTGGDVRTIPDPSSLTTAQLHRELASLRELIEARLDGTDKRIEIQFTERDKRAEQTAKDSKVAVDAAFSAAKEAVGEQNKSSALAISKSEAATTKQIDSISSLISASSKATDEKIEDVKARLQMIEGQKAGVGMSTGVVLQIILGASAIAAIVAVVVDVLRH